MLIRLKNGEILSATSVESFNDWGFEDGMIVRNGEEMYILSSDEIDEIVGRGIRK